MKYQIIKIAALFMFFNSTYACQSKSEKQTTTPQAAASITPSANASEDGPEKTGTKTDARFLVTYKGFGLIKITDNYDALVAKYNADNISEGTLANAHSEMEEHVTYIFKGQAKEIIVHWSDYHKTISKIEAVQKNSPYKDTKGVGYGTTMKELDDINLSKITFVGFAWEFAGTITDFNMGDLDEKLAITQKNIRYNIAFNGDNPPAALTGDIIIDTDNETVKANMVKIFVDQIFLINNPE